MNFFLIGGIALSVILVIIILYIFFTKPKQYGGNNGTVNGDTYCQGAWGSVDGVTRKNLKCINGIDLTDNITKLNCTTTYGPTGHNYAYNCI